MKPDGYDVKMLSVAQLKKCLEEIDDDMLLMPNQVGNLAIHKKTGEKFECGKKSCPKNEHEEIAYIGWVDFGHEGEVEWIEKEKKDGNGKPEKEIHVSSTKD